ncbi:MAG: ROK family protein [Patescibacteria group bacterium]|jgi:predicted NBD/HSP70 family sugar kinase
MYVIFDIGGTKTRIGVSRDKKTFQSVILPTNLSFVRALGEMKGAVQKLSRGSKIDAVIGGVRALDKERGVLRAQPHYPLWAGKPLRRELERMFSAPVFLENDAALAALGEATVGAGRGSAIVAYLTVSTGVGGAVVTDGRISKNARGFEPGSQIITHVGKKPIRLEELISGFTIEKRFGKPAAALKNKRAWQEAAYYLAVGINNMIVHWSPGVVVLGGGLFSTGGISIPAVRKYLKELFKAYSEIPPISRAALGDSSALFGALAFAKQVLH